MAPLFASIIKRTYTRVDDDYLVFLDRKEMAKSLLNEVFTINGFVLKILNKSKNQGSKRIQH